MRWALRGFLFLMGCVLLLVALLQILIPDEPTRESSPLPPNIESSLPPATIESPSSTSTPPETSPASSSVLEEEPAPTETKRTNERASTPRSTTSTTLYESVQVPTVEPRTESGDFWYDLATCESGNGRLSDNQFQFMGGTEKKVGYYPGMSYEDQKAAAIWWAQQLRAEGIHPGSTAGWPECWWIAGGT